MTKKCISLKQPFAELLISGKKTIELRTWNTKFRGEFFIHASKKIDNEACQSLKISPESLVTGAMVGKVNLHDVKIYNSKSSFTRDRKKHFSIHYSSEKRIYGFQVNHAERLRKPLFMPGKLGFFDVEITS